MRKSSQLVVIQRLVILRIVVTRIGYKWQDIGFRKALSPFGSRLFRWHTNELPFSSMAYSTFSVQRINGVTVSPIADRSPRKPCSSTAGNPLGFHVRPGSSRSSSRSAPAHPSSKGAPESPSDATYSPANCAKSQQNFLLRKYPRLTIVSPICIIVENRQLYGFIYNIHKVRKVYKLYRLYKSFIPVILSSFFRSFLQAGQFP